MPKTTNTIFHKLSKSVRGDGGTTAQLKFSLPYLHQLQPQLWCGNGVNVDWGPDD